jgi:hypothetical protein
MTDTEASARIDRLLDAIDLVKFDRRREACDILRELIRENNDFEDAWLWMAVAVDAVDKSEICLDNVLRINPRNTQAAGALYRLRETEMLMQQKGSRLRVGRDLSLGLMWLLVIVLLYAVLLFTPLQARQGSAAHTVEQPQPGLLDSASSQPESESALPAHPTPPQTPSNAEDIDY